jgi:hypothetical protein
VNSLVDELPSHGEDALYGFQARITVLKVVEGGCRDAAT